MDNIQEGWFNKPKGALQMIYERGWIDPEKPHLYYTLKGKTDIYGIIDESTSIKCLMKKQTDFLEQETLLQYYSKKLGVQSDRTPISHPEVAGEGIEFDWGASKLNYRSRPLCEKRSKEKFHKLVSHALSKAVLSVHQCRHNARRARNYMLAYKSLKSHYDMNGAAISSTDNKDDKFDIRLSHSLIEQCVKLFQKRRTHRNVSDFDMKYIKNEAIKNVVTKMSSCSV